MKVGVVHTAYLLKGGEDIVVEQEKKYMVKAGVHVTSLYFKNPHGRLASIIYFLMSPFNIGSMLRTLKWIKKEKPDIIHIHNWHYMASPAVLFAAKKKRIPVVYTLHNFRLICPSGTLFDRGHLFLDSMHRGFPWAAVRRGVYRHSYIQTFWLAVTLRLHQRLGTWAQVTKYIALTKHAREIFMHSSLRIPPDQIVVKSNFVSATDQKQVVREPHFLFVGRLSEEKGICTLLQAFAGSPYKIVLIGEGPLEAVVKTYASCYPNIITLGFQERPYILEQMRKCEALIFPSVWYEGNPVTIIEALACGTPVIASRLGAMETMVTDGYDGVHFEPGCFNSLNRTVAEWKKKDAPTKNDYSSHARQTYESRFSPDANIRQLITIYQSAIAGNK